MFVSVVTYDQNYMSYGTKMVPPHTDLELTAQQQTFVEIYG